jgi:hypothetical protein
MRHRRLATAGFALFVLAAFPNAAHASFWDWIWSLSGPEMMGTVFHCEWDLEHDAGDTNLQGQPAGPFECRVADLRVLGAARERRLRRMWLSLDQGIYFSTGKNVEGLPFEKFDTWMYAFEPLLEVRSAREGDVTISHGLVGLTYNVFFGDRGDGLQNVGLKFRPVGITYKRFNAVLNMRWYPNRYRAEDFGFVDPRPEASSELSLGVAIGFLWKGR